MVRPCVRTPRVPTKQYEHRSLRLDTDKRRSFLRGYKCCHSYSQNDLICLLYDKRAGEEIDSWTQNQIFAFVECLLKLSG